MLSTVLLLLLTSQLGPAQQQAGGEAGQRDPSQPAPLVAPPVTRQDPRAQNNQAERQTQAAEQQAVSNKWVAGIAFVALLIAVGQAGLFFQQLEVMKGSLKDTSDAAKAAQDSARAAIVGQRAYVFLDVPRTSASLARKSLQTRMKIGLHFINLGRTPAFVDRMFVSFAVHALDDVFAMRNHPDGVPWTLGFWLGADVTSGPCEVYLNIPQQVINEAFADQTGQQLVVMFCRVCFEDVFGNTRETGIAAVLAEGATPLEIIHNKGLNYSR